MTIPLRVRHNSGYFLVGPTATGKSAVAQRIAEDRSWLILSADSMLVYRGMDIGTAKPSRDERTRVTYRAVDVVDPGSSYSVAQYRDEAGRAFTEARDRKTQVIVVGGSGLYVKALLAGLDDLPASSPEARQRWTRLLSEQGIAALQDVLRCRYPAWYEAIPDRQNGRRLIRALELAECGCTQPPRTWRSGVADQPCIVGLQMRRELLLRRIEERVRAMYAQGLLQEAERLLASAGEVWPTASQAVGYAEAIRCLRGQFTEEEAIRETIIRTRQLAKRQMTWFRRQALVRWIDVDETMNTLDVAARVCAEWEREGAAPVVV